MRILALLLIWSFPAWALWDNGYTWRASITIDNTKVAGAANLTNFPVLISGTYDGTGGEPDLRDFANGGDVQSASGWDIRFETTGGTQLDHEIESYTASTGAVVIWVEVGTVDYNDDTVFYMFWGKGGLGASEENVAGTWNSGYMAVWHLNEAVTDESTSSDVHIDSTSYNNHGDQNYNDDIAGKFANGQDLDGTNDVITATDSNSLDIGGDKMTISAWIFPDVVTSIRAIAGKPHAATHTSPYWKYSLAIVLTSDLDYRIDSTEKYSTTNPIPAASWSYVVGTYDGADMRLYDDGGYLTGIAKTGAIQNSAIDFRMGTNVDGGEDFDGIIDEVRISNVQRTGDWITTEYNSQNSPSTFYGIGTPATQGGAHAPIVID